jgi:hypothetical protein
MHDQFLPLVTAVPGTRQMKKSKQQKERNAIDLFDSIVDMRQPSSITTSWLAFLSSSFYFPIRHLSQPTFDSTSNARIHAHDWRDDDADDDGNPPTPPTA